MTWKSACYAVQGRDHKENGVPCQDKTTKLYRNGIHVVALADGSDRAKHAHVGAERAVGAVADYIAENFDELLEHKNLAAMKRTLARELRTQLIQQARELDCALSDLASTLLAVGVRGDQFVLAHVGNGVIGWLTDKSAFVASGSGKKDTANENAVLTAKNAADSMYVRRGTLRNINGFILMSEGTGESLYNKASNRLGSGVKKLVEHTAQAEDDVVERDLMNTLSTVMTRRTPADCSIAILARESRKRKKGKGKKGAAKADARPGHAAAAPQMWKTSLLPMAARTPWQKPRGKQARAAWKYSLYGG